MMAEDPYYFEDKWGWGEGQGGLGKSNIEIDFFTSPLLASSIIIVVIILMQ